MINTFQMTVDNQKYCIIKTNYEDKNSYLGIKNFIGKMVISADDVDKISVKLSTTRYI